jgi:hypothetical protein
VIPSNAIVAFGSPSTRSGTAVLYDLLFLVFALCERKNKKQKKGKFHAAGSPEPVEGQAIPRLGSLADRLLRYL